MDGMGLFSGMLCCADCGHVLHLSRTQFWTRDKDCYFCGTYKEKKGQCTAHYVREVVMENIRNVISMAHLDEGELVRQIRTGRRSRRKPRPGTSGSWRSRSGVWRRLTASSSGFTRTTWRES